MLQPTWGLVSTEGVSHCAATYDTVGFFANHVDDLDLVARAYRLHRGEGEADSAASEKPLQMHGLRVAMIKTPVWYTAKPATSKAWQRAIDLLAAAGAHVEAVDLPTQFRRATRWYEVILASEIQSSFLSRNVVPSAPPDISWLTNMTAQGTCRIKMKINWTGRCGR